MVLFLLCPEYMTFSLCFVTIFLICFSLRSVVEYIQCSLLALLSLSHLNHVMISWSVLLDAFQESGSQIQYFFHDTLAHFCCCVSYVPSVFLVPSQATANKSKWAFHLPGSIWCTKRSCLLLSPPSSYFVVSAQSQLLLTFLTYFII